ncbi:MAG: hypothetical protein EOO24_63195 [Comamonadaceae bacterium]|nr:MAG: hypothetical protein EOO24_63195 [Comamonadaceae bacterium]
MMAMAALSWAIFAVLALLWTGAAWITAAATDWLVQALAGGTAVQAARDVTALPIPEWARLFIDPAWFEALQAALRWTVDGAGAGMPLVGALAGWIVPVVWTGWGLGMLLLVGGALGVHMLLRRMSRRSSAAV